MDKGTVLDKVLTVAKVFDVRGSLSIIKLKLFESTQFREM